MNKKPLMLMLVSLLLLSALIPAALSGTVVNTTSVIIATIGEPETCDPAWLYDTASAELCQNVYEPLIFFDVDRSKPRAEQGLTDVFVPRIATSLPTVSGDGLTITFEIRDDVPWQDHETYGNVTPGDVEYSFERWMVQCRSGGPTWMILEPLFGFYSTRTLPKGYADFAELGEAIDDAVESNSTHVWFNLHPDFAGYPPFNAIVAQSWAGILCQQWCIDHDDWPGFEETYLEWRAYNNPDISPLDDYPAGTGGTIMMGAGPYSFDYWHKGDEWSVMKFDEYYQGWPASLPGQGGGYATPWVERYTEQFIDEWATRKMMFLAGDADFCYVPRMFISELITNWPPPGPAQEKYVKGTNCDPELPELVCSPCLFMNFNVSATSPLLGVHGGYDRGVFAEKGMSREMFDDIDARLGFAYAFDHDAYIDNVYMGEAELCPTPIIAGLPYNNPDQEGIEYNLTKAEEYLKAAWGGDLWASGFTMGISYNTGNVARQVASEMVRDSIEGLNPLFHVEVTSIAWPKYLGQLVDMELTIFVLGWLADYPDPHNFAFPFMHTEGDFSCFQNVHYGQSGHMQTAEFEGDPTKVINNTYVDNLIILGIKKSDPDDREAIYYELQEIYVEETASMPLCKPVGRHWERTWVMGWYHNPIYPGGYGYHYWKGFLGDTDRDYDVDLDDLYNILINYCNNVPPAPADYDADGDGHIGLGDLYYVLKNY